MKNDINSRGMPEDYWTPFKHLQNTIEKAIIFPKSSYASQLEITLRKHKQNFAAILKHPPKDAKSRSELRQGVTEGISLPGIGHTILSKDIVDESIILSDMYDMNEYVALELLCTAQQQMPYHPGLPRGLVAVLLYYDGRKAMACSVRDLFQARKGVSWCTEAHNEITHLITSYTDSLVHDINILNKIVDLLDELDISKELDILTKNRALGTPKHHRQVIDLFEDIRHALAMAIFNWSAQCGLPKTTMNRIFQYLSKYKSTNAKGCLDDVTTTILVAVLYGFDTSALQRYEDGDNIILNLPIIKEYGYAQSIYDSLQASWECNGLKAVCLFAFALAIASLKQVPQNLQNNSLPIIDQDENLLENAIQLEVFNYIHYNILESEMFFTLEFFARRMHNLFTDFIDLMHSKVTELRARADETARTVQTFMQQGLDPPDNLCHNFESLMMAIGKFYVNDKLGLCLCLEYWGPMDVHVNNTKTSTKSVSLFKFVRLAGELLPPTLFIPYLKMLKGLSSCEQAARNTFNLLKQGSGFSGTTTLSWEHFFGSLGRYYSNLRQEQHPASDTIYKSRLYNRSINPQEIAGLHAVLDIIRVVALHDEVARTALCEHPNWAPLNILLGLLGCSVPIELKADICLTLAALAKSKDTALQLWNNLEASQIIVTIPTTSTYNIRGLETDIEQNESRNESYPLTQAALELLYVLCTTAVPKNLGGGPRKPGLDPYVTFVVDTIFLRFYNRNYKNSSEKWKVGEKCLKLLNYFTTSYEVNVNDFVTNKEENSTPGFHVILQMNTKSETLRLMLHIIDEACAHLDTYGPFAGKKYMEKCAQYILNIIEKTLVCQDEFFVAHSSAGGSMLLSGLNKLLLDINPRSGKPDHILNTTKFVTYNSWLPEHAFLAVKILTLICHQPYINSHILGIITQNDITINGIRHGFVECLEAEQSIISENNDEQVEQKDEIIFSIKEAIINLIKECLPQPAPNIAHYLLGFDITKDIRNTLFQQPGVQDFPSTCTKSLVMLLDNSIELRKSVYPFCSAYDRLISKAYELLYLICLNAKTSNVVLRFLRSCNNFLCRHATELPFKNFKNTEVLNQMSFLMKSMAIELKVTASNSQISQFSHLCKILLGISQNSNQEFVPLELSHYYLISSNEKNMTESKLIKQTQEKNKRLVICYLLDCLEFDMRPLNSPKWDFFDNSLTTQLLQNCEVKNKNGPNLIDIRKLHEVLKDELNTVQNTIASGQRQIILQEIEKILLFAIKVNSQKNKCTGTTRFMEAWGQLTEILFIFAPSFVMSLETKQELILEILQCLLSKVVPVEIIPEMATLTSSTILILMVNLRCYLTQKHSPQESGIADSTNSEKTMDGIFSRPQKANTLSLKYILKNIVEWIIISGVASQKLRINLYASLLNYMHIVKGKITENINQNVDPTYISRLDRTKSNVFDNQEEDNEGNQIQMTIDVLLSFGDKLVDVLCHDCIGGHDICKMLALSCIDVLIDLDTLSNFIHFISKRGYLSHLVDSLMKSDKSLCHVLVRVPENLRALYVYESKMAMLCKLASSHVGAEMLLEERILGVLSTMSVFDLHPDFETSTHQIKTMNEAFLPSIDLRYQQLLFPALNLCDVILSTLSSNNHSAVSQVVHFLLSHGDMVEVVLRAGTPFLNVGLLKELSGITGIIARVANQEISNILEPNAHQDLGMHLYRLQKLMLSLFSRFILHQETIKKMLITENTSLDFEEENISLRTKYFLEIASNLATYCRNAISNHSADHRTTGILFSPNINELVQKSDGRSNTLEIAPSLGMVVSQLKCSVEYYNKEKQIYDSMLRQKSTISTISIDTTREHDLKNISEQITNKQYGFKQAIFITEQCLYLLWCHLDFYMSRAIPTTALEYNPSTTSFMNDSCISSSSEAGWKVTLDDISHLKKALVSIFNETFCKHLLATTEFQPISDKGFTEALLRRIKHLIQFVPVE